MASAMPTPNRMVPTPAAPSGVSISLSDTVPASVMVAGIDRSIFPGPSVMTNICPSPTMTEKAANVNAACANPPALVPPVAAIVTPKTRIVAAQAQAQGLPSTLTAAPPAVPSRQVPAAAPAR